MRLQMPSVARFITLKARLENKSGSKWLDLYENHRYPKVTYYYTCYNGGEDLGAVTLKEAAAKVMQVAKKISGLKLIPLSEIKE